MGTLGFRIPVRMLPSRPVESTGSRAERRVFDLLAATPDEHAVAMHSLRLPRHRTKRSAEADFVVVSPLAVIVIEVKGGRVARREGHWVYEDRHGRRFESVEGPFVQAEGAMHALRHRLIDLGARADLDGIAFGYLVITPDCRITATSVEWEAPVYIDERSLRGRSDLRGALDRAGAHWRSVLGLRDNAVGDSDQVERIVGLCRPDFEGVESLGANIASVNADVIRLSEQQFRVLDLVERWDRLVVEGPAGSGKTLLAAESARRRAESGERVLVTVQSPVLAAWLMKRLGEQVQVVPHRALDAFQGTVDVLICDEAQDVMSESHLETLDRLLADGLESGKWQFFLDSVGQRGVLGEFDTEAYAVVRSWADGAPLVLAENVRNTAAVVAETVLMTGLTSGRVVVQGEGRLLIEFVESPEQEARAFREQVRESRSGGILDGQITLLTPSGDARLLEHLPREFRGEISRVGISAALSWPLRNVSMASIADFKGMENDVVIVADLWEIEPEESVALLYTAMTRARSDLMVIWPQSMAERIDGLKATNYLITRGGR
jgi:hypothetical protein